MHVMHTYVYTHTFVVQNSALTYPELLPNLPIAFDRLRSMGASEIGHLLIIVEREDSRDDKVTFGHKARLKVILDDTHTCCQKGQNKDFKGTGKRKRKDVG